MKIQLAILYAIAAAFVIQNWGPTPVYRTTSFESWEIDEEDSEGVSKVVKSITVRDEYEGLASRTITVEPLGDGWVYADGQSPVSPMSPVTYVADTVKRYLARHQDSQPNVKTIKNRRLSLVWPSLFESGWMGEGFGPISNEAESTQAVKEGK